MLSRVDRSIEWSVVSLRFGACGEVNERDDKRHTQTQMLIYVTRRKVN